jgi:hypothetical protein
LEEAVLMLWLESKKTISFICSLLDICVWSLLQGEQIMLEEAVLMLMHAHAWLNCAEVERTF